MKYVIDKTSPLMVALFWGLAFIWIKQGLESFDPLSLVTLRVTIASVGFILLFAFRVIRFKAIEVRDIPLFVLLVACGVFIYHLCLVKAETFLPASVASLIGQTMPIFAILISSAIVRKIPSLEVILGVLLASVGSFLIVSGGGVALKGGVEIWAVLLCLAAPFSLAVYTVAGKPLLKKYGPPNLTAQVFITSSVVLTIMSCLDGDFIEQVNSASFKSWLAVIWLAGLSTVAAYTLWFHALSTRSASELSMYNYCVPIFSLAAASFLLGEQIDWKMVLGGTLVIGGILTTNMPEPFKRIGLRIIEVTTKTH